LADERHGICPQFRAVAIAAAGYAIPAKPIAALEMHCNNAEIHRRP
jgi:hypothetical protein